MRVAIAEDGALFRQGLVVLLEAAGHDVAGCVSGGNELVDLLGTESADVAGLDLRMPPRAGWRSDHRGTASGAAPPNGAAALVLLLPHYAETHYLMRILGSTDVNV